MIPVASDGAPPPMAAEDIARIADLLRRRAGLRLPESRVAMLQARLSRRLRHTGLPDFASYTAFVQTNAGAAELRAMIAALTTNVTHFFRERHHFALLRDTILPPLVETARCGRAIRIWSAGSSSGQEAFSIAITLALVAEDFARHDIRILATDIDAGMIAAGREALYDAESVEAVPAPLLQRFFEAERGGYRVIPDLRRLVSFREHNLHGDWPMRRLFDVIFCRNVAIYFDPEAQLRLWRRMQDRLAPGGWLLLGHSERIPPFDGLHLQPVALTTYRSVNGPAQALGGTWRSRTR